MERKIMMAEVFAARQEMGLEEIKTLTKMATAALTKLHTRTMGELRLWVEEQERIAALPKDPNTLLAVQAGLIKNPTETHETEQKENTMPPKEKKTNGKKNPKRTGPVEKPAKPEPFKMTDRVAFQALANVVWEEKDRPDVAGMSDDMVAEELREATSLLAPEDEETVLAMDHGKEIWDVFCGLRKELAQAAVAVTTPAPKAGSKKVKEPKVPKEKKVKEPKVSNGSGVIASIEEFLKTSPGGISKQGILAKLVDRFPAKKTDSMKATINVQVPSRMAKERGLKIDKRKDGDTTLYFIA